MAKKYEIGVIPADGTGPDVVAEGIKVLAAVAEKREIECNFRHAESAEKKSACLSGDADKQETIRSFGARIWVLKSVIT